MWIGRSFVFVRGLAAWAAGIVPRGSVYHMPLMPEVAVMDETLTLLRDLVETPGAPGHESAVRAVIRRYLEPLGEVLTDNLGSVAGRKAGTDGATSDRARHRHRA